MWQSPHMAVLPALHIITTAEHALEHSVRQLQPVASIGRLLSTDSPVQNGSSLLEHAFPSSTACRRTSSSSAGRQNPYVSRGDAEPDAASAVRRLRREPAGRAAQDVCCGSQGNPTNHPIGCRPLQRLWPSWASWSSVLRINLPVHPGYLCLIHTHVSPRFLGSCPAFVLLLAGWHPKTVFMAGAFLPSCSSPSSSASTARF